VRFRTSLHVWDLSYEQARRLQDELARRVELCPLPGAVRYVAGADAAFSKEAQVVFAAAVVLAYPELEVVERAEACVPAAFPYIPGLLSFREGPAVLEALRRLQARPDVVMFDGQGIAHPRRLGLAAHMGLWLGLPTVGCAKSRLVGEHEPPGMRRGAWKPLTHCGELVGSVLRTRSGVRPLYVSPGHLCDHAGARRLVLSCCTRYRLPEPTRQAHLAVARQKRVFLAERAGGVPPEGA